MTGFPGCQVVDEMKGRNDFVIIANAWSAGEANPTSKHRIAIELAARGHRVLWIEGSGMRTPSLGSGSDRGRIARKLAAAFRGARRVWPVAYGELSCSPDAQVSGFSFQVSSPAPSPSGGIWVLSPLLIPLPRSVVARWLNGWLCALLAGRWCRRLAFEDPVLINYVPVLAEAMRMWGRMDEGGNLRPVRVVYHCVDRWDAFAMYDSRVMAAADAACCRRADMVIASSRDLFNRCRAINENTHLVTHGVDYEHFASALRKSEDRGQRTENRGQRTEVRRQNSELVGHRPADLPPGRIVGFFGLLSEWLDQDLLVLLARALDCQDSTLASIVLIGQADVDVSRLKAAPGILLLGPKRFSELPDYIRHFDVGIIPFVVNELTVAVNPIKLREMMAAGCPVVSTAMPEVEAYVRPRAVVMASDYDAFSAAVRALLREPLTHGERATLSASMKSETWAAKVDELCRCIGVSG